MGGRLNNGDAYLVARKLGIGHLIMLGSSLDLRAGNLPSRQAFVPFIHELVYFLANPGNFDLNLDPKWELALNLAGNEHAFSGHGLRGEYFAGNDRNPRGHANRPRPSSSTGAAAARRREFRRTTSKSVGAAEFRPRAPENTAFTPRPTTI